MKLRDYLAREGLTYAAFGAMIGTQHARTVERYASGSRIPDRETMPLIVQATGGEVTPNDFFDLPAREKEAA